MTTPLVLRVLQLNEQLDTFILRSFNRRLIWNCDRENWALEKNQKKLLAFNIVMYPVLAILVFGLVITLLLFNQFYVKFLSLKIIIVLSVTTLFASFAFQLDILMYCCGSEAISTINYYIYRQREMCGVQVTKQDLKAASLRKGLYFIKQ